MAGLELVDLRGLQIDLVDLPELKFEKVPALGALRGLGAQARQLGVEGSQLRDERLDLSAKPEQPARLIE